MSFFLKKKLDATGNLFETPAAGGLLFQEPQGFAIARLECIFLLVFLGGASVDSHG